MDKVENTIHVIIIFYAYIWLHALVDAPADCVSREDPAESAYFKVHVNVAIASSTML